MFSPAEAKVVGSLTDAHLQGVRDFKFADGGVNGEGWSIGGDGTLVQWDLKKNKVIRLECPDSTPKDELTDQEKSHCQMDPRILYNL